MKKQLKVTVELESCTTSGLFCVPLAFSSECIFLKCWGFVFKAERVSATVVDSKILATRNFGE